MNFDRYNNPFNVYICPHPKFQEKQEQYYSTILYYSLLKAYNLYDYFNIYKFYLKII